MQPVELERTTTHPSARHSNLDRLLALRWFVIAGCTALLVASSLGIELVMATPFAWVALGIYALSNAAIQHLLQRGKRYGEAFFLLNLALDLVVLYVFLHFSGGAANPFTLLFLLPVIVAAATLKPLAIWVVTALAIVAYSVLLWQAPAEHSRHAMQAEFDLHVVGMWLGLVFIAGLVGYFVAGMGQALRARERELALARERALRDERVIALGALAAGAAHELGTPLGTMAVLTGELKRDNTLSKPEQTRSLELLEAEIERCKTVLSSLGRQGHEVRAGGGRGLLPSEFLDTLVANFRSLRPEVSVQSAWQGPEPDQRIVADQTLSQALVSLLNNAADAAPGTVAVTGRCPGDEFCIDIEDHGLGLTRAVAEQIGYRPVSTKSEHGGLGIGVLLSQSVIERLGGALTYHDTRQGHTLVRVRLPRSRLAIDRVDRP